MAQRLVINLPMSADDLLTGYGAGALVYTYSASSEAGSYSQIDTEAIVSGTEQYEIWDSSGTSSTWYKSRFGNAAASLFSDYSAAFQGSSLGAYATLDDLLETLSLGGATAPLNQLADLLADVSDELDATLFRSFHRYLQVSGTTTVYCDIIVPGQSSLVRAMGAPYLTDGRALDLAAAPTTVKYRASESTSTYTAIASGDTGYYLEADIAPGVAGTDKPYSDIILSPSSATINTWPVCRRGAEIVAPPGWPRIPRPIKRAVIARARAAYQMSPLGGVGETEGDFGAFGVRRAYPPDWWTVTRLGSPWRKSEVV